MFKKNSYEFLIFHVKHFSAGRNKYQSMKYEKIMFNSVDSLYMQMFYDKEVTSANISTLKTGFIHVWNQAKKW